MKTTCLIVCVSRRGRAQCAPRVPVPLKVAAPRRSAAAALLQVVTREPQPGRSRAGRSRAAAEAAAARVVAVQPPRGACSACVNQPHSAAVRCSAAVALHLTGVRARLPVCTWCRRASPHVTAHAAPRLEPRAGRGRGLGAASSPLRGALRAARSDVSRLRASVFPAARCCDRSRCPWRVSRPRSFSRRRCPTGPPFCCWGPTAL
jgi:hypothetical protein